MINDVTVFKFEATLFNPVSQNSQRQQTPGFFLDFGLVFFPPTIFGFVSKISVPAVTRIFDSDQTLSQSSSKNNSSCFKISLKKPDEVPPEKSG